MEARYGSGANVFEGAREAIGDAAEGIDAEDQDGARVPPLRRRRCPLLLPHRYAHQFRPTGSLFQLLNTSMFFLLTEFFESWNVMQFFFKRFLFFVFCCDDHCCV